MLFFRGTDMKRYEIVYEKYKSEILSGYLKFNDVLPSIRSSVKRFGFSQTTIEHAYEKLMLDGYIESIPQKGYVVSVNSKRLMMHKVSPRFKNIQNNIKFDFRLNSIDEDSLDITTWKRYMKEVFNDKDSISTYGDAQGEMYLRQVLSMYAYHQRGVLSRAEQIIIGSSFQSLLFSFCSLIKKQSRIGLAPDTNKETEYVFRSYGFDCVRLDKNHIFDDLDSLNLDYFYLNSAYFNGHPLSLNEAKKILYSAYKHSFYILEDDYNGELTYVSKPRLALQSMDEKGIVLYFGSFSRLLAPSIRLSYLVLNKNFEPIYQINKNNFAPMASRFEQLALAKYIENGDLEKRLRKLKKVYAQKARIMYSCLNKNYIEAALQEPYLSYGIKINVDSDRFYTACRRLGIRTEKISKGHLELSFASMDLLTLEEATNLLVKCLEKC